MSIPTVSGCIAIEVRTGTATAETCDYWRNVNDSEDMAVYRYRKTTHTYTGGSWYEEWTYSDAIKVNGSGTCDDAAYNSTFDSETDYGTFISDTNEYSDPVDPADVLAAAQGAIIWGSWSDAGAISGVGKQTVFEASDEDDIISVNATRIGPVVDAAPGSWKIVVSLEVAEVRFKLWPPLPGTITWKIGDLDTTDEEPEFVYGSTQTHDLTPSAPTHTVSLEGTADGHMARLKFTGVIFLPFH